MDQLRPYTRHDWIDAVNLSALLGPMVVVTTVAITHDARSGGFFDLWAVLSLGLLSFPIALPACWVIGAPILSLVMRRPIGWLRAAVWGGVISAVMTLIFLWAFYRLLLADLRDPSGVGLVGDRGVLRGIGVLVAPFDWREIVLTGAACVAFGVVTALIVRAIIGPGRQ